MPMTNANYPLFVDAHWLAAHLGDPDVIVLDSTWALKSAERRGRDLFSDGHIPGARFLDIDSVADTDSPYATMLPSPRAFAQHMAALGISRDSRVIITANGYTAGRGWFLLRVMGHPDVRILQGGNKAWLTAGFALETGAEAVHAATTYVPEPDLTRVVPLDEMKRIVASGDTTIVDARTAVRFTGEMASSHGDLPGGHMPGAINIPYAEFLDAEGRFVDAEAASAILAAHNVPDSGPVVVTCGSGISALVPGLMLEQLGRDWRLYDGSWNEWAQQPDTPKVSNV